MSRGGGERGRHRIRNRLQALSCQHRARRGARTPRPRDRDRAEVGHLTDSVPQALRSSLVKMDTFFNLWGSLGISRTTAVRGRGDDSAVSEASLGVPTRPVLCAQACWFSSGSTSPVLGFLLCSVHRTTGHHQCLFSSYGDSLLAITISH